MSKLASLTSATVNKLCYQWLTSYTHISGCGACLCTWSCRVGKDGWSCAVAELTLLRCLSLFLSLSQNRQTAGVLPAPAEPLQTVPFVKLSQGEVSPQMLQSCSKRSSTNWTKDPPFCLCVEQIRWWEITRSLIMILYKLVRQTGFSLFAATENKI